MSEYLWLFWELMKHFRFWSQVIQEFRPVGVGVQTGFPGCRFWKLLLIKQKNQNPGSLVCFNPHSEENQR